MRLLSWLLLVCSLLSGCKKDINGRVKSEHRSNWERVQTGFPPPICEGTPRPYPQLPVVFDRRPELPPVALAETGYRNLSVGRPVSSSDGDPIIGKLSFITDGDKTQSEGTCVELYDGPQWVQLDLGKEMTIHIVWIWHRSGMDTLVYHDVIIEVSNDPAFKHQVVQVFNNDYDNSSIRGLGMDRPYTESRYGKPIQVNGVNGRYVRCYSNGSSWNVMNHYVEVEVFGHSANNLGGREPMSPVDPMPPGFKSFEKYFWEEAIRRRLVHGDSDGLNLKGSDELIIRIFLWDSALEGGPLESRIKRLDDLMQLANELWNQHHPALKLRNIEVRSNTDRLLRSLNPGAKKD